MPRSGLRVGSFHGPSGLYQKDLLTVHPTDNFFPKPSLGNAGEDGFGPLPGDTIVEGGAYQRSDGSHYMRDPMTGASIPINTGPDYWEKGTGVPGQYVDIRTGKTRNTLSPEQRRAVNSTTRRFRT